MSVRQIILTALIAGVSATGCRRDAPATAQPAWQPQPAASPAAEGGLPAPMPEPAQEAQAYTKPSELFAHVLGGGAGATALPRIDPEAARTTARAAAGVRSVVWIDATNLLVLVDGAHYRTHRTIDEICLRLQALGDASPVLVNLQNVRASNGDELEILRRACQQGAGFAQQTPPLDALDPALREQHRAEVERIRQQRKEQRREQTAGDRKALQAIPQI